MHTWSTYCIRCICDFNTRTLPTRTFSELYPQAKMFWSLDERVISSWRRRNASFFPSPVAYSIGMFTSNKPINEYALSSTRVIVPLAAHDTISATHGPFPSNPPDNLSFETWVIYHKSSASPFLSPMVFPMLGKFVLDFLWCYHLLKCPPTRKPLCSSIRFVILFCLLQWERRGHQRHGGTLNTPPCLHTTNTSNCSLQTAWCCFACQCSKCRSTPTHTVWLRLLAGIHYLFIAQAITDLIPLFPVHLGKDDHLFVINFHGVNLSMW